MKLLPEASLTVVLDREHTAILDGMRNGRSRNYVAKMLIELALRENAVEHGASPIGPRSDE